ncbi:lytic transglycosylase domain-containing protein [Pararhizobium mangrovi]|uniref:Lytic transglycosylase domain-containing protein n=1 Tax=Pararhizobium mangrovi TaxID=2590452 RepID=A0A506UFE8_9HYPH|nr:lytic transglycosylase domain-containing protein [Pararhizobium mangrovi]TPW31991.1 lytic transglycosylase domain-containing protein [Pararhizobium mangrovi]
MTRIASSILVSLMACTVLAIAPGHAEPLPIGDVPLPLARPFAPQTDVVPSLPPPRTSPEITASIPRAVNPAAAVGDLKDGLDALTGNHVDKARAIRSGMPAGSLDRQILAWAIAISGSNDVPAGDIAEAAKHLQGWPGGSVIEANYERALAGQDPAPAQVLSAFSARTPETLTGKRLLADALLKSGQRERAAAIIRHVWRTDALDSREQARMLRDYSGLLRTSDHLRRMEMLLYRSRITDAEPISEQANAQSLFRAWAAVIRKQSDAKARIDAVHPMWHDDPGYRFLRVMHLRHEDEYEAAAKLLEAAPHDVAALVNPGEWWDEERIVSRDLIDDGKFSAAYRIVADSVLLKEAAADSTRDTDRIDAEFHAGWYALRGLRKPKEAAAHFRRILSIATSPISRARGYYWLGRAAEAGAPGSASAQYARAAAYPATFYGQLAAAKLGRQTLDVTYPSPSDAERQAFAARPAVHAIKRLQAIGYGWRANLLYRDLARTIDSPGQLAILTAMAEDADEDQLSLQLGKIAYYRGVPCAALAFPLGAIPRDANISGSGMALAYAVARQESAFNQAAVSPANARGLLQLMPTTAKRVAAQNGMSYSKARLTQDAAYNATLGAHYLGEQIADFGGSYILTFVAYNAGPRRVKEWIDRFGDPRGKPIDEVVDWIERIPYPETRNYIQRVLENYEVYKARLGQKVDIVHDLRFGRS